MKNLGRYYGVLWSSRTWNGIAYLSLGLPLGVLWGVYAAVMLSVGVALLVLWVGIPLLAVTLWSLRGIGSQERALANSLLSAHIPRPGPVSSAHDANSRLPRIFRWGAAMLRDDHAWRVAVWAVARMVLGPVGFVVAIVAAVVPVVIAVVLVQAVIIQAGWGHWAYSADAARVTELVAFWVLVGSPVLVAIVPMFAWASRAVAAANMPLARWALGPAQREIAEAAAARATIAEEQVRIDQELHDSIGHMITMNIVQAGAGSHVFDTDSDFARQALKNIEERGRSAMGELDRIIATIRGEESEVRTPLPGINEVPALIAAARHAGMQVEDLTDTPDVPAALGRAAFSIVREALTNVGKHAPGASVTVTVRIDGDALGVSVVNSDGSGAGGPEHDPDRKNRHGVAGIRDRVGLLGGRSSIGPLPDGGFEVRALLPLEVALAAPDADAPSVFDSLRAEVAQ